METSEGDAFSISCCLDQSDFLAWHRFFQRRNCGEFRKGFVVKAAVFALILFACGFALLFWFYRPPQMDSQASLIIAAVAVFVSLLIAGMAVFFQSLRDGMTFIAAWWQFRKVRRLPQEKRNVKLALRDDGIYVENADGNSLLKWHAIESVADEEKHLFFLINQRLAYVVPKRVLSPSQLADFGEFGQRRWQESHQVTGSGVE